LLQSLKGKAISCSTMLKIQWLVMNDEKRTEDFRGHLWHRYSVTVNQVVGLQNSLLLYFLSIVEQEIAFPFKSAKFTPSFNGVWVRPRKHLLQKVLIVFQVHSDIRGYSSDFPFHRVPLDVKKKYCYLKERKFEIQVVCTGLLIGIIDISSRTTAFQFTRFVRTVLLWGPSTNKTDRHDITEILLKVALKHHKPNQTKNKEIYGLFIGWKSFLFCHLNVIFA
jgi:hypothetical protein